MSQWTPYTTIIKNVKKKMGKGRKEERKNTKGSQNTARRKKLSNLEIGKSIKTKAKISKKNMIYVLCVFF
jgi:hypothetical protein